MRTKIRDGDTMIALETAPATIEFGDILASTRVVADNDCTESPWERCDGFKHTVTRVARMCDKADGDTIMRGYACPNGRGNGVIIELPDGEDHGIFDYLRARGATKQVAREAVAAARRKILDTLTGWYADGWQWYGVACDFSILGEAYGDSVWGIDNEDYAHETKTKIALEVASRLEGDEYTVINRPVNAPGPSAQHFGTVVSREGVKEEWFRRVLTADRWREEWKRNLASQNWSA